MMIHSLDGKSRIELELVESDSENSLRSAIGLMVVGSKVRGEIERVWIEEAAVRAFIQNLHRLVITRDGSATLISMTPGELELTLSSTKGGGNALVGVRCRWPKRLEGGRIIAEELNTSFELAASSLDEFVSEIEAIFVPILAK